MGREPSPQFQWTTSAQSNETTSNNKPEQVERVMVIG